jgi:Alw26I/Eco31I/Esp3I family type II restriction endonuclease
MNPRKEYETNIKEHPNYDFMPNEEKKTWVSVSKKGQENTRLKYWTNEKKRYIQLGMLPADATPANLARLIHPTKIHICKICNQKCSIFYIYPNKNTIKWLNEKFPDYPYDANESIFNIYENISHNNKEQIFQARFGKIDELKYMCFNDKYNGKNLSPGVMANPPDRLDGFHCYNSICACRKDKDKGRSDENMKTYSRDRRAYEMFSDGNILLTNKLMGKLNTIEAICVGCNQLNKMTGDHIGPISLGFVHDTTNIQARCNSCNSRKNNRLTTSDYDKLCLLEENEIPIVSWWAKDCWSKNKKEEIRIIQEEMNKNAKKFIMIIEWLKTHKNDIVKEYIKNNYIMNNNSYSINTIDISSEGDIQFTYSYILSLKQTKNVQHKRTQEILLENQKDNRKIQIILTSEEISALTTITHETFKNTICTVLQK